MTTTSFGPIRADRPASPRRAVLHHLRPAPRAAAALLIAIAAATALPLLAPQLTRRFVDEAAGGAGTGHLSLIAVLYLVLAIAGQAARTITAWLASRLAWDGTNRLREQLAEYALGLDLAFHGRHTPGEMIERVDGDVVAVADFVVAFLLDVVAGVLLLAGVLTVVLAVDLRIGGALLGYCALMGWAMVRAQRLAIPSARIAREEAAALSGFLEERLAGAEDIRAGGAGAHTVREFHRTAGRLYRAEVSSAKRGVPLVAGTSLAFAAGTALILGLAAWARQADAISVGTVVLLFQYAQMVRSPFERLVDQLRQYQAALGSLARMGDLLAERPTLPAPAVPLPLPADGALALHLDGVGFGYADDGETVLEDIDLRLAPGETLGLVGRTGSGKTTIARLVLRLYDPTSGAVRVGGVDLRQADPAALRQRIGVVTQDIQLFAASVRDNLTLFREDFDDETLRSVLADVGLAEWLAELPDGLDAPVTGTSAGEAQLLALARAFLADPGLVVLDEASSRLDPATERRVEKAVHRLLDRRTGVLIAHRLSSLSFVDHIAVVESGRIVEFGRRAELAADPASRFARLLAAAR
ncbi:MAG TPA: ABC transporter ATP-binding protein [Mycobacteriales bacterium]|nr:ABC transporter ATP-binding protein [Mycobacteriales bacterium]